MNDQTINVLLVEDNPADARLVYEALRVTSSPRFQVTHVECLSAARECLTDGEFDVVLLDLVLPDKPLLGNLIEIHDQASRVPIVVLTGMDDETMAAWSLEEGAQDYLVKGQVDGRALVRCIRYAIDRHKTTRGSRYRPPAARFREPS